MKRHYYIEVGLLLILSVAAATLAADHHLYDLMWEYFHFDKNNLENSITFIRLVAFGAIIVFSILNIWKHLHSEKKIVESLLASVHRVFFSNIQLTDSTSDNIYRITCHKFYSFSWPRTVIGHILFFTAIYLVSVLVMFCFGSISLTATTGMVFTATYAHDYLLSKQSDIKIRE